jgi:hypothetical protein
VHVKKDAYDAYCGRRMGGIDPTFTRFGNPFRLENEASRGAVLADYLGYLMSRPEIIRDAREALAGKAVLACWGAPAGGVGVDDALVCHVQILARALRGDYDAAIARLEQASLEERREAPAEEYAVG